eukprot:TRINITY_DN4950_c0_g1_i1.p1 TRINITY_DN4950_c0_g1~~TRINITY_DN4950_c0_g1_i1.p1  ORF type:complete len:381 (-),score=58.80 TRINITY_DN4950_c0_g1_i1:18-1109(-)
MGKVAKQKKVIDRATAVKRKFEDDDHDDTALQAHSDDDTYLDVAEEETTDEEAPDSDGDDRVVVQSKRDLTAFAKRDKSAAKTKSDGKSEVYRNKEKVLISCSRGISHRYRHLLNDLVALLPHSKKESKMEHKDRLWNLNEVCELRNCNSCLFLDCRKKKDLYMWLSKSPAGPSVKFLVQNVHTMDELKLTGNHLKGSRPMLVFDSHFDAEPHLGLLKDMFSQMFNTPRGHGKSKPFVDHVLSLSYIDNRIWFRNYQIIDAEHNPKDQQLVEVGPRFVLDIVRIFAGSFCGATIFSNPLYQSPNQVRIAVKRQKAGKYASRVAQTKKSSERKRSRVMPHNTIDDVFDASDLDDSDAADLSEMD